MANLADDDLLLVQRTSAGISTNYCITGSDLKEDLGGVNGLIVPPVEVLTPLNGSGITVFDQYEPLSSTITAVGEAGTIAKNTDDIQSVNSGLTIDVGFYDPTAKGTNNSGSVSLVTPSNADISNVTFESVSSGQVYDSSSNSSLPGYQPYVIVDMKSNVSGFSYTLTGGGMATVSLSVYSSTTGIAGSWGNKETFVMVNNSSETFNYGASGRYFLLVRNGNGDSTGTGLNDVPGYSYGLMPFIISSTFTLPTVLSFPTNTNFSGLSVGDVVQATATGSIRASYVDDDNTIELKDASGVYIKVPSSYSTGSVVDFSDFLQQHNITKVVGIRLISNNSNGGYPVRLYRLEINGLQYEKGDRTTGETIVISNETGTASNNASADDWMNVNTGARYVRSDDNASYSFDFSPNNEPTQAATITAIDASGPSQTDVYATFNPLSIKANQGTLTNGNLELSSTNNYYIEGRSTIAASSFDNYSELTISSVSSNPSMGFAVGDQDTWIISGVGTYLVYRENGAIVRYPGNTTVDTAASYTQGDVLGMAVDSTNVKFYKNGSLQGTYAHQLTGEYFITAMTINGNVSGQYTTLDANFGATAFAHTPPSGYVGLSETVTTYPSVTVDGGDWLSEDFLAAKVDQMFSQSTFTSNDVTGLSYIHDPTSGVSITASQSIILKNYAKNITSSVNYHVYTSDNGINWTRVQVSVAANTVTSSVSAPYIAVTSDHAQDSTVIATAPDGDRHIVSSIPYEKSLTFSDTTELANMVTPLEMVDANGDVVTPVSDTIANVNNNVLTLQGNTNLEYFQPGDEVQTGVEIVSVDTAAPSITVDGGDWLGADAVSYTHLTLPTIYSV